MRPVLRYNSYYNYKFTGCPRLFFGERIGNNSEIAILTLVGSAQMRLDFGTLIAFLSFW